VLECSNRSPAWVTLLACAALAAACGGSAGSADAAPAGSAGRAPAPSGSAIASGSTGAAAAASADTVAPSGLQVTHLTVGGHPVTAEVADNDQSRTLGLMNRDSLPPDHGMLFVYPQEQTLSFWMRDTRIPLDIAFVNQRGVIVDIQHMQAESDDLHSSSRPSMYALEMAKGWFAAHDVKVGDTVDF
jgi:hypothetical protein